MREGSKYQPLLDYLHECDKGEVILTFAEIEALMNNRLPASARTKRAWWSNRTKGALQAEAWMEGGYRVEDVDLDEQKVTFRKANLKPPVQRVGDTVLWNAELIKALRRHMGLTQAEFAERLGVRQKTVSNWENELYLPPRSTCKHLELLADTVGFRYEE
ncbi:helix-turn-helix domain-containing protein [Lyngbya aestuarii]|uniref:helix-turn-helix domain-containing protein n=1 Tax=Lyngbya aestuarii TaxID=118322 RepID=UPI00058C6CE9